MRQPPDQDAGFWHLQVPASAALASVVPPAGRMTIALAGAAPLGVRDDVINVALPGRPSAARRCTRRVPDLDQMAKQPAGHVFLRLARMRAGASLEPVHGQAADPRTEPVQVVDPAQTGPARAPMASVVPDRVTPPAAPARVARAPAGACEYRRDRADGRQEWSQSGSTECPASRRANWRAHGSSTRRQARGRRLLRGCS